MSHLLPNTLAKCVWQDSFKQSFQQIILNKKTPVLHDRPIGLSLKHMLMKFPKQRQRRRRKHVLLEIIDADAASRRRKAKLLRQTRIPCRKGKLKATVSYHGSFKVRFRRAPPAHGFDSSGTFGHETFGLQGKAHHDGMILQFPIQGRSSNLQVCNLSQRTSKNITTTMGFLVVL